jgi:competence protein ComEC
VYLFLGFGAGVVFAATMAVRSPFAPWLVAVVSAGAVPIVHRVRADRVVSIAGLIATGLVLVSSCGLGVAAYSSSYYFAPADDLGRRLSPSPSEWTLTGRVIGAPQRTVDRTQLRLRIDSAHTAGGAEAMHGDVRLTAQHPFTGWAEGQCVQVSATLTLPPLPRNPAEFPYATYLRRQGIRSVGIVDSLHRVVLLAPPRRDVGWRTSTRHSLGEILDRRVHDAEARSILRALLIGDRSQLDESHRQNLARTGLAHLLAVSGLHVLLVGMLLYHHLGSLLNRTGWSWSAREHVRGTIVLIVLVGYAQIVGPTASVVRAVTMAGGFLLAQPLQRPSYPLNGLSLAGVVLLYARPAALFDAGFQLSFAAVASLVILVPSWRPENAEKSGLRRIGGRLWESIAVSLAATLGTALITAAHFGQIPLAGIALNTVAIPATSVSLLSGILLLITDRWGEQIPSALAAVSEATATLVLGLAAWGERWLPALNIAVPTLPPGWAIGCACLVGVVAAWRAPRWRWRLAAAAVVVFSLDIGLRAGKNPELSVLFFDVGQGDAALVRLPGGRTLLIDAGPRDRFVDRGERTLVPHFARYGIHRIDNVLITHPHSDHLGGLPAVLRSVPVGRLLVSGSAYRSELVDEVARLVDSLHVPVRSLVVGDTLRLHPSVHALVLGPSPALISDENPNEASVVLRLQFGETVFLFLGDVERGGEHMLVERSGPWLAADVVKVAHHGSETSSTPRLVARVAADSGWALVSVAKRNRYGLPSDAVLTRWRAAGSRVLETSAEGAIWLRSDGETIRTIPWRRGKSAFPPPE